MRGDNLPYKFSILAVWFSMSGSCTDAVPVFLLALLSQGLTCLPAHCSVLFMDAHSVAPHIKPTGIV